MTGTALLPPEEAAYYLKLFRQARYKTLEDAEDFKSVCYALEEFGRRLTGAHQNGLGRYSVALKSFVGRHNKVEFDALFSVVKAARNDVSHQGVFARNLASKAAKLVTIIEEELYTMTTLVRHVMVEGVVFVQPFHTLSKVREIMLENSFSHLPVKIDNEFLLISDHHIVKLWSASNLTSNQKYVEPLIALAQLPDLPSVGKIRESDPVPTAYQTMQGLPLLVLDNNDNPVGILTPFDLL
ncbi:hypothetical protein DAETH_23700 [Deinococcus aetherius]|uniref:CBS domain-containing protein n=1 Tax=Deinococcus aetherius TaxID=200252 RepID=A0ABM8AF21_9DEIO|nr:CBS domain-containing protein [Deinococcus aetherius]BDP42401.1 hypothetical protein DAETH_23700 [Deinococcus aetherius]